MYDLVADTHHTLGIALHNLTWTLLEAEDRSAIDARKMLAYAEGSLFHWHRSPRFKPINAARGHWMISRVHAVLGNGESALEEAGKCAAIVAEIGASDFDLAYALEAEARAQAALGKLAEARSLRDRAAAVPIADPGDKAHFDGDLAAGPWFDLTD